ALTRRFDFKNFEMPPKVPFVGWSSIKANRLSPLLEGVRLNQRYYFVHSYHVCCDNPEDVLATCQYGYDFTAVVHHGQIFGTQFHPEKSHREGMQLIRNFVNFYRSPATE